MSDQGKELPAWCERLHQLADAAVGPVLAAGWRVRSVCVIVEPELDTPDFVLGSAVGGAESDNEGDAAAHGE